VKDSCEYGNGLVPYIKGEEFFDYSEARERNLTDYSAKGLPSLSAILFPVSRPLTYYPTPNHQHYCHSYEKKGYGRGYRLLRWCYLTTISAAKRIKRR